MYVLTDVAVTPTEAPKQSLPCRLQGRNGTVAVGDVLLEWKRACRIPGRQPRDVPIQKDFQTHNLSLHG